MLKYSIMVKYLVILLMHLIAKSTNTKFLGLITDNMLTWKGHIDQLMSKLSSACYAIRAIKPFMSQETTGMISHIFTLLRPMV
jgi:hypothetical protein